MSTRSAIVLKHGDEQYFGIYCHNDGYPDGVGFNLFTNYQDPAKVAELINLGDISSLGESPSEGSTFAYGRDRGEEDTGPIRGKTAEAVIRKIDHDYAYVFEDGVWTVSHRKSEGFPLETALGLNKPVQG